MTDGQTSHRAGWPTPHRSEVLVAKTRILTSSPDGFCQPAEIDGDATPCVSRILDRTYPAGPAARQWIHGTEPVLLGCAAPPTLAGRGARPRIHGADTYSR